MLISLWEACLSLCLPGHVTIFYEHRGGVLWNIAKLWCNFEWISTMIWVCPTFQSSNCGHTNHLVSVSFIVRTKSAGGNVSVGNAQLRGLLSPARSLHVDSGCNQKGGLAGIPRGFYSHECGTRARVMSPLSLPRLLRGWRLEQCDQPVESTIYIIPEPTERRTQHIKDTERVKSRPVTMATPTFHRLRKRESFRKTNVWDFSCFYPPSFSCVLVVFNRTVTSVNCNWHDAYSEQAIWINGDVHCVQWL